MTETSEHDSDRQLVARVLRRDPAATREFGERMKCIPRMVASLHGRQGYVLDQESLRDLSQEVLLSVWRKLETFEGRARLETWVYRFCYLGLMNRLRSAARRPEEPLPEDADVEQPELPDALETDDELGRLLRHLTPHEARVVRLRHVEELEFREIAEVCGVSTSSAKTQYYRAIEKLRRSMGGPA